MAAGCILLWVCNERLGVNKGTRRPSALSRGVFGVGLALALLHQVTMGEDAHGNVVLARVVYGLVLVLVGLGESHTSFVLLAALLHDAHNVLMLGNIMVQRMALLSLKGKTQLHPYLRVFVSLWFGRAARHALGGTNALGTIDISGAYTGFTAATFNPVFVGVLSFLISYTGPILLFDASGESLALRRRVLWRAVEAPVTIAALVSLLAMRHHLFVWSVFAPRFLYTVFGLVCALMCSVRGTGRAVSPHPTPRRKVD